MSDAEATPLVLTERQQQVLGLVAAGLTAEEIGSRLQISTRTARAHLDVLRVKLHVRRARDLPLAFRTQTGLDPLVLAAALLELARTTVG